MRFWLSGLFHNSEILRKPSLNLYIINYIRFSEMKINVLKGLFFFSPNLGMQLGMIQEMTGLRIKLDLLCHSDYEGKLLDTN